MSDRDALTFGERLEVEAALDAAFGPLRDVRTDLSPLRVRAAVRWGRGTPKASPQALKWSGAIARLSELSVAVGMSVMIFGAALGPAVHGDGAKVDPPLASTAIRITGPSIEEQREIHATRNEWLDSLRARLDALRSVPLQDWLDPSVVRPSGRRLELPAPRPERAGTNEPY